MYEELIEVVPMLKALQVSVIINGRIYFIYFSCYYFIKLFQSYERMNLADALVPKYYQNDDCIINQGDPGDGMYFVEEGIVNVIVTSETGEKIKVCKKFNILNFIKKYNITFQQVNQIEKGGYFGELALVTHKGRAASVFAAGKVKLACMYYIYFTQ